MWFDPPLNLAAMSGILKIHSNASDGGIFGHSWIEYCPIDGHPVTYGTWGNHPEGGANGLRENLEAGQRGDYCRAAFINRQQVSLLFAAIEVYRRKGPAAWSLATPCSSFAADAWEAATGEKLAHKTAMFSTPARLARAIAEANANDSRGTKPFSD
jgi:hypothetical protein